MANRRKAVTRRYFADLFGKGDLAVVDEIFTPDCVIYPPAYFGEPIQGREGVRQFVSMIRSGFPDFRFTVGDEMEEGEKVGSAFRLHGTHNGAYMGLPPTGRTIDLMGMDLFTFSNDRIKEVHIYYDTLGLMTQLGVVPSPA